MAVNNKMQIEIWSDIMCPFCYIGKRKFEAALAQFPGKDQVSVIWRSFQLDPTIESQPGKDVYTYLAERKGQSREWAEQMHEQVVNTAREVGLEYNFDKAIIANSLDAHRLIQLSKKYNLGDAAEERLFKAYFTEGKDTGNHDTLVALGVEIGLDESEIRQVLKTDAYTDVVKKEAEEAGQLGARGVPFFVMDRKYAVAGAQPTGAFLQTLEKSFAGWQQENPGIEINTQGEVCTPDGDCK